MLPNILRNATTNQLVDAYLQGTFQKETPTHHYPTRTKVARAASAVQQMEAAQIKKMPPQHSTLINTMFIIHQMSSNVKI